MAADACILAVVLLICGASLVIAQNRCSYMTAIPREPKPDDLPDIVWSGGWSDRPFVPAPERGDLCMDEYIPITGTSGTQVIFMDESIEGDIPIAKINYQGPETPEIVLPLLSGSANMLGPEIRLVNSEWFLYITQRQDFELPGMQQYMFNVRIAGESFIGGVSLQIVNIDDNDPIIQAFGACQVPELGEPRLTECVYEVTDADGEISTRFMEFRIDSDRSDDLRIFYIHSETNPADWFRMTMTIGITEALDFELNALHIFQVTALDSIPNTHTVTLMVQVENVPHRHPRWVEIFAVQQIDEKEAREFLVRAIDADTGINGPIYYRLETEPEDTFFSIQTIEGGRDGAIFKIDPIDRDYLERELFALDIVAFKHDNESAATATPVVIIVNDINDQIPEPIHDEYHVSIPEETPLTIDFDEDFGFHDRDLGAHATYSVHLESVSPPGAADAFYIAPLTGYQRQLFIMGTINHSMLDFEDIPFQHIHLKVVATDLDNNTFIGVAQLFIDLENWNDELPIFENSIQTVSFKETEGAGFYVGNVRACDLDIGDIVEHSLMGNAAEYLEIDIDTGDIHVSIDEAFDFHRQNQLFIQIRADDTLMAPFHTETAQLVINLEDVNNVPPTLRLPRGSPPIEENIREGCIISNEITATDPDTTARLEFEIDWETSYATKQGRETDPREFYGCAEILTVYPNPMDTGAAVGHLLVKEIPDRPGVTIDFEEFELLYLTIRVRDLNTVLNEDYDESTFTVTIIDMNDNAPIWAPGTLTQFFRVREMSGLDTVIGSVMATDLDGPLYNQVRYTIFPREDTPDDLVNIDFVTGQITTIGVIDADIPPRWNLYYTVIASDKCSTPDPDDCPPDETFWDVEGEIAIQIIDTNNKEPFPDTDRFEATVYIYENATSGDDVVQLYSIDYDRDEMYHTVSYQINYLVSPRLRPFFEVDQDTGRVYVEYTTNEVLDRDGDEPTHRIFFILIDNFLSEGDGNRNQNATEVLVVLLDVNDNAPQLPTDLSWSISENLLEGVRILPEIFAPDRDEPDTDNSRVGYDILELTLTDRYIEVPELFNMIQIENVTGELETAMDLKGYWGTYAIHIEAYDHGHPQQKSDEVYQLVVRPWNFNAPQFVFPEQAGRTIRLARETATANRLLMTVNNEVLDSISAIDNDGLTAGVVTFTVSGDDDAVQYFEVLNIGNNVGNLQLTRDVTQQTTDFQVTIRATDGGEEPGPLFTETTLHLVFVPTSGDPVFSVPSYGVAFFEREVGLTERFELPRAEDPKNHLCSGDCHDIYYSIYEGNDDGHFALDPIENVIYLATELDREEAITHTLTVAASNSPTPVSPQQGALLTVEVTVREAHPRPYFERSLYTAGIAVTDSVNRELLVLHATHSEGATITYTMDMSTMVADPTLSGVQNNAFVLSPLTGVLTLNMQPNAAMQGMFEFDVVATDPSGETDRAEVKIFLVSGQNRVFFIFLNTVAQIEAQRAFIAQTFAVGFGKTCNIDQIIPATDDNGVASETSTEMRAHFIEDGIPVHAEVIEDLRSDTETLLTIRTALLTELIILQDFLTESSPELATNPVQITVYILAGLSVILAFLVVVLLMSFIFRTRALNRQLAAITTNKFGSVDSGLNRAGLAAPNTNMYNINANPILNETINYPDFDALSDTSDDSDLIGIEDMPQFKADYFPPDDSSLQDFINEPSSSSSNRQSSMPNHSNNFGYNSSPFPQHFTNHANTQFSRR